MCKKESMDFFYNLSHYVPLLPVFCPTQGYPLKFLALTHTHALLIGFEERFHQDTMQMHLSTCS
jgi:hypothetical protein